MTKLIDSVLKNAVEQRCSDIHFTYGLPPIFRRNGVLVRSAFPDLNEAVLTEMAKSIVSERKWAEFMELGEADSAYTVSGVSRFRINIYRQRGNITIAARTITSDVPNLERMGLPPILKYFAEKPKGLCLITGPTGSGKSTTLAAMIDYINITARKHIVTLEDPIEYVHENKQCVIEQREIGMDTQSFPNGLRASLRQDPDVILVGEIRDQITMRTSLSAAETGHLVLGTLHTSSAAGTIERIVSSFEGSERAQVRIQLANSLLGVMSQHLLPNREGNGRVLSHEIMINTPAISNLIRMDKIHQITNTMQTSKDIGMHTMQSHIQQLLSSGVIAEEVARPYLT